jgi:hypothetical protein
MDRRQKLAQMGHNATPNAKAHGDGRADDDEDEGETASLIADKIAPTIVLNPTTQSPTELKFRLNHINRGLTVQSTRPLRLLLNHGHRQHSASLVHKHFRLIRPWSCRESLSPSISPSRRSSRQRLRQSGPRRLLNLEASPRPNTRSTPQNFLLTPWSCRENH